jgi:DNA-binding NarL/FixJ family response regulator
VRPPIRLAIVDDYAVVIAGVASLLAEERIDVVETGASMPVVTDVDIVLYDTFGQVQGEDLNLEDFVRDSGAKVVIYSWNLRPGLIHEAMAGGASGYLSKVLTGPVIVQALERILAGERVILTGDSETSVDGVGDWPGRSASRGGDPRPDRARLEQSGDRRTRSRERELDQVLHPLGLPQDRGRTSHSGGDLGDGERFCSRHGAHDRPCPEAAASTPVTKNSIALTDRRNRPAHSSTSPDLAGRPLLL